MCNYKDIILHENNQELYTIEIVSQKCLNHIIGR